MKRINRMHKKTHKTKRMKKNRGPAAGIPNFIRNFAPQQVPGGRQRLSAKRWGPAMGHEPPIDETAGNTFINIQNKNKQTIIMATKDTVLETMRQAGTPLAAGKIAELSGLDRKEVDKAMKELKAEGAIVSPVRCKWEPAQK